MHTQQEDRPWADTVAASAAAAMTVLANILMEALTARLTRDCSWTGYRSKGGTVTVEKGERWETRLPRYILGQRYFDSIPTKLAR